MSSPVETLQNIGDIITFYPDAALAIDLEGRIVIWNKAMEELTGVKAEEMLGKGNYEHALLFYGKRRPTLINMVLNPDSDWEDQYQALEKEQDALAGESFCPGIGETGRFLWSKASLLYDANKKVRGAIQVVRDVTERRMTEKSLRELNTSLQLITDNMLDMICQVDINGLIQYVSPSVKNILGFSPQELLHKPLYDMIHSEDRIVFLTELEQTLNNSASYTKDLRCSHKDGHYRWLESACNTLKNDNGEVVGAVFGSRDITERKKAEAAQEQSTHKLQKTMEGIIQAMGLLVGNRDPYTESHQKRVACLACAIAAEMGFDQERIEVLRLAAEIHDIGKIAIPSEILTKPGKLNSMEFDIIKTHPKVAAEILEKVDFPWPVARIVAQHHEKIDGSGYYNGLSGDEILLESRILSVADVVEAITSHRPYRPALGLEKALKELSKHKNIFYDGDVVNACGKLLTEKSFEFPLVQE